jgi:hypothetical protein
MSVLELCEPVEVVAGWRKADGADNPAGPLFGTGEYAATDIIEASSNCSGGTNSCLGSQYIIKCC